MKRWKIGLGIVVVSILAAVSCKKDEPAPKGCTVTFKGSSFSLPTATCGTGSVSATNNEGSQQLDLISTDTLTQVSFVASQEPNSYYSTYFTGLVPKITISGKTWTFNAAVVNDQGDGATVSGSCVCNN